MRDRHGGHRFRRRQPGSRGKVCGAAKYADVLFDFPWIDDFAAARNAVLDRCSGVWHLQLDADEWLDESTYELEVFLRQFDSAKQYVGAAVVVRNYTKPDLSGDFSEVLIGRLLRRASGIRFTGTIHEHWEERKGVKLSCLTQTVLHHDGYAFVNTDFGRAKLERNMALLKKELEKNPDDLRTRMQCFESSADAEKEKYARFAIEGVRQRLPKWDSYGVTIFRNAVLLAKERDLPELKALAAQVKALLANYPADDPAVAALKQTPVYQKVAYLIEE